MATIQDRWHRKNRETGKPDRTALYGKGKRYGRTSVTRPAETGGGLRADRTDH